MAVDLLVGGSWLVYSWDGFPTRPYSLRHSNSRYGCYKRPIRRRRADKFGEIMRGYPLLLANMLPGGKGALPGEPDYCAVKAPSTAMARPVTREAESEQSQATASAISSGVPLRPMGWRVGMAAA